MPEVMIEFYRMREELVLRLHRANGIDLAKAKVQSPFFRLLKIELGQALRLMCAHDRRHLWQAREVMADPAFPPGGFSVTA
jgi:hypothetical protein